MFNLPLKRLMSDNPCENSAEQKEQITKAKMAQQTE